MRMRGRRGVPRWVLAGALGLPLLVFTIDLGTPSLWDPDEGRHAEIAREMLLTGDWLIPQLNFEPYREKLPTYYWMLATSLSAFRWDEETSARLPSAIFAIVGAWMAIFWGARHLGALGGMLAGLVLTTAPGYVGIGRLAMIDGCYTVLVSVALLAMSGPLLSPDRRFPLAFWLVLSAAVLIRGPVALLLAALVAASFVTAVREPKRLLRLRPFSGVLLLSLLVSPLWLRLTARDPEYLPEFLWRYNVLRYLNSDVGGSHSEPFLFYLWFTPLLMLPWAIFLPWSLRPPRMENGDDVHLYLLSWIAVFLAFFTFSAAKFPTYVLPTLFPLSLLTAGWLDRRLADATRPRLRDPILVGGAVIFLVVILAPLVGYQIVAGSFPTYTPNTAYLLLMIPFAIPGLAAVAGRSRLGVFASITACTTVCLLGLYRFGSATVSAYNSMEVPAELIVRHLPSDASIISYRTTTHSLSFYSGRPSRAVESLGDATSLLDADHPTALLTKDRYLPDLRGRMKRPLYFWWEADSKKILLANRPPPNGADLRILLPISPNSEKSSEGHPPCPGRPSFSVRGLFPFFRRPASFLARAHSREEHLRSVLDPSDHHACKVFRDEDRFAAIAGLTDGLHEPLRIVRPQGWDATPITGDSQHRRRPHAVTATIRTVSAS